MYGIVTILQILGPWLSRESRKSDVQLDPLTQVFEDERLGLGLPSILSLLHFLFFAVLQNENRMKETM